nr:MAG TPA: hypothetical protein [Caudoviricetes sp.]
MYVSQKMKKDKVLHFYVSKMRKNAHFLQGKCEKITK